jgi:hypothetical protein
LIFITFSLHFLRNLLLSGFMSGKLWWYFADWALTNFCKWPEYNLVGEKAERTLLKIVHHFIIIVSKEGNCNTLLASSTRTTCVEDQKPFPLSRIQRRTDAVNIGFDCIRHLEVDDQGNIRYIDTSTSQVGCDENVSFAIAELGERSFSLLLGLP